jgi:hypothetical protein
LGPPVVFLVDLRPPDSSKSSPIPFSLDDNISVTIAQEPTAQKFAADLQSRQVAPAEFLQLKVSNPRSLCFAWIRCVEIITGYTSVDEISRYLLPFKTDYLFVRLCVSLLASAISFGK